MEDDKKKLSNKRDNFTFPIPNFPFVISNIPVLPSHGAYTSQLAWYSRVCVQYIDILDTVQLSYSTKLTMCPFPLYLDSPFLFYHLQEFYQT